MFADEYRWDKRFGALCQGCRPGEALWAVERSEILYLHDHSGVAIAEDDKRLYVGSRFTQSASRHE